MDIFNSEVMWIVIALFSLKLKYSSPNIYGSNFRPKSSCKRDFASLTLVKCLVRYLALVFPRISSKVLVIHLSHFAMRKNVFDIVPAQARK